MNHKKIYRILTLCLLAILVGLPSVYAHPPSAIDIVYDQENSLLKVDVSHRCSRPREHYIRRVYIFKNDEQIEKLVFVKQDTTKGFSIELPLALEENDTVRIKAICNQAGIKEQEFSYHQDEQDQSEQSSSSHELP